MKRPAASTNMRKTKRISLIIVLRELVQSFWNIVELVASAVASSPLKRTVYERSGGEGS
jgi:type II secretory pathway component PulC